MSVSFDCGKVPEYTRRRLRDYCWLRCVVFHRSIVSGNGVFNTDNPTTPINIGCSGGDFDLILNNEQRRLCRNYGDKVLSTIAIGVLQALNQCQKLFVDSPWNCSVFADSKTHYLGRFAETGKLYWCIKLVRYVNRLCRHT